MNKPLAIIINFGMGNLFSVRNSLINAGFNSIISDSASELLKADILVLPGVGAFKDAINTLKEKKLDQAIYKHIANRKMLLGICLGHQLLFKRSHEFGITDGLSLLDGEVIRLPLKQNTSTTRIPNIGWNTAIQSKKLDSALFAGIPIQSDFYFIHSYYAEGVKEDNIIMTTKFGDFNFCSAVMHDLIIGFQFHPERSGIIGQKLYSNIYRLFVN